MIIDHAFINSDSGPFVFIRLPSEIDQSDYDVAAWAQRLSVTCFDSRPVVVHNHNKRGDEVTTVSPDSFRSAVAGLTGAGIGLSPLEVEDLPPKRATKA